GEVGPGDPVGHGEDRLLRPADLPPGLPGVDVLETAAAVYGHGGRPSAYFAFTAPKAAKQTFLCRTSTWANPTSRNKSSWNNSGRGVSSFSTYANTWSR